MKNQLKTIYRNDFNIKGGEFFQRMGYLLKLSSSLYSQIPYLSEIYTHMMKDISKRNALRINSKFKKAICKCNNLLFQDPEAGLQVKRKHIISNFKVIRENSIWLSLVANVSINLK